MEDAPAPVLSPSWRRRTSGVSPTLPWEEDEEEAIPVPSSPDSVFQEPKRPKTGDGARPVARPVARVLEPGDPETGGPNGIPEAVRVPTATPNLPPGGRASGRDHSSRPSTPDFAGFE
eukprot:7979438-Alexandrium_andersonii.AAC.1